MRPQQRQRPHPVVVYPETPPPRKSTTATEDNRNVADPLLVDPLDASSVATPQPQQPPMVTRLQENEEHQQQEQLPEHEKQQQKQVFDHHHHNYHHNRDVDDDKRTNINVKAKPSNNDDSNDAEEDDTDPNAPEGCYLIPDKHEGSYRFLYTRTRIPRNALGFWCPSQKQKQAIPKYKFAQPPQSVGSNDRYRAWCLLIKEAKQKHGYVVQFTVNNDDVAIYGLDQKTQRVTMIPLQKGLTPIDHLQAVSVVPRHQHQQFYRTTTAMTLPRFLQLAEEMGGFGMTI